MCFRNKMNLLPLGASNSILFFSETRPFFFSPKKWGRNGHPDVVRGVGAVCFANARGVSEGVLLAELALRCLLRKCVVCFFPCSFLLLAELRFTVCFANALFAPFFLFLLALAPCGASLCFLLRKFAFWSLPFFFLFLALSYSLLFAPFLSLLTC